VKSTPSLSFQDLEEESARKANIRKFNDFSSALRDEMAAKLKSYEKTPEKHPLYPDEWKKFWNRRYKELTTEGKDASKHDFKPEWIKFWTVRMKELHEEEMKNTLSAKRNELGLPEEVADDDQMVSVPKVESIKDSKREMDPPEEEITTLHTLRLMAALESQLSSLGPRVNSMLSQALSLERIRKGGAEGLLSNPDNVVLLETVKEKLKGQLFAGIVEGHMLKGTRKAIGAIVDLFAKREKMEKVVAAATVREVPPRDPLVVPGVGVVDKIAIAQQIAAALVAQGKTDVTEAELEQLVEAVVGVVHEKKVESPAKEDPSSLHQLLSSIVSTQADEEKDSGKKVEAESEPRGFAMQQLREMNESSLKSLFFNFKHLTRLEQKSLSIFIKDLEGKDRLAAERFQKMINSDGLDDWEESEPVDKSPLKSGGGRLSPFSSREGGANPTREKRKNTFIDINDYGDEDDDDDYSYEDIFKAAKKNVKITQAAKKVALAAKKPRPIIDPNDLLKGLTSQSPSTPSDAPPINSAPSLVNPAPEVFNPAPEVVISPVVTINPAPEVIVPPPIVTTSAPPPDDSSQWNNYNFANDNNSYDYSAGYNYGGDQNQYQGYENWNANNGSNNYDHSYPPPDQNYDFPANNFSVPLPNQNFSAPPPTGGHYQQYY